MSQNDLRQPQQPKAIALTDVDESAWPMVTFVGAVLLSLMLLALVAGT